MAVTIDKDRIISRAPKSEILETSRLLWKQDYTRYILNALSDPAMILNEHLQLVFVNQEMVQMLNASGDVSLLGKRFGEALDCVHSTDCTYGCGTSTACQVCGAYGAIKESLQEKRATGDCQIQSTQQLDYDLQVTASPLPVGERMLSLVTVKNIADTKRRRALERIFFHDILNTASLLFTQVELMAMEMTKSEFTSLVDLKEVTQQLVQEIQSQRLLLAAESGDLEPNPKGTSVTQIGQTLTRLYSHSEFARGKHIVFEKPDRDIILETDVTMISRVIGNMLKNALEACETGETVTLSVERDQRFVRFHVHNDAYIAKRVQLSIFKRSFSTKGQGRGLGTYSMRMLSERYLFGKVWFQSQQGHGTTFTAEYPLVWPRQSSPANLTELDFKQ